MLNIMLWNLIGLALIAQGATQQPRDGAAGPAGTATIRGRIVAAATGQPLHRVRITLNGALANPPTTVTDTDGVYELTDVPAGSYTVSAARAGFLTLQFGQRRPREAGRVLDVHAGETITGVDLALPKGGVIAGRILDELGEPAAAVRVEAMEFRYIRGRRVAVPARIATTNDVGEYRLSGLEPGAFQIRASARDVWESDDGKQTLTYAATYYPGVTAAEQPPFVNVALGQEVPGIDLRLIAGRASRITGIVEGKDAEPLADQAVHVDNIGRTTGGALMFAQGAGSTKTNGQGTFEISKLAPGEYMVYSGDQRDRIAIRVVLTDGDVEHVVLSPKPGTAINGSVVTDEGSAPPFPPGRVRVNPISADPESVLPVWNQPREQPLTPDWTFRVANANGQYLFRMDGLPPEWMLKAVLYGGKDITDAPFTVLQGAPDVTGLQVVISRRGGKITGDVVDAAGAAAGDTTVIAFAEDKSHWRLASRFVKAVRPDRQGRFTVAGLPPGPYRVAAQDFVVEGQWEDPGFLERLLKASVRVELKEAATETITLRAEEAR